MKTLALNALLWIALFFYFLIFSTDTLAQTTTLIIASIYNVGFIVTKELKKDEDNTDNE